MTKFQLLAATAILLTPTTAWGQTTATGGQAGQAQPTQDPAAGAGSVEDSAVGPGDDIVVTAQRTAERLQDVPIAVSAFSAASIERQQIRNPLDLQLTLPNIQFTKGNFTTSSSLTIRGIGDLCVGVTCDAATAIHLNDEPLFG